MMKNKRKYLSVLVLSLMLFTGCQLALEGKAGESFSGDRFVGVFVTRGSSIGSKVYIDTEIEEMTEEELSNLPRNENGVDGKFYAEFKEEEKTYDFNQEGYTFISVEIRENEEVSYSALIGEVISDASSHFTFTDEEEKSEIEGTIRYTPESGEAVWYFNPVYQEEDGDVYAMRSGPGMGLDGAEEGSQASHAMDEFTTVTENGVTKTVRTNVKVNLVMMFRPEMIRVIEMDEQNKPLSEKEYEPGKLPETYKPLTDAEYIIVETHKKSPEGTLVSREIFDETKENLETYFTREDGIISINHSIIEWTE